VRIRLQPRPPSRLSLWPKNKENKNNKKSNKKTKKRRRRLVCPQNWGVYDGIPSAEPTGRISNNRRTTMPKVSIFLLLLVQLPLGICTSQAN
jgi:hypothetical protein